MAELPYPDEPLSSQHLTLGDFCLRANTLLEEERVDDFTRFVLAGRDSSGSGNASRIFIDAIQSLSHPPLNTVHVTRDYDSVIGISRTLPYAWPLAYLPMPSFRDTLTKSLHIKDITIQSEGEALKVPLHQIPNVAIGKVHMRHVTRIFFPRLYRPSSRGKDRVVSTKILERLYDQNVRSVLRRLAPSMISSWPSSYSSAERLSRDNFGRYHFSSYDIPPNLLSEFTSELLRQLDEDPDMAGAFFVHEMRGIKGWSAHDGASPNEREDALKKALCWLQVAAIEASEDWYIDIGLNHHHDEHNIQWLHLSHEQLLCSIFSQAPAMQVSKMASSSQMHIDYAAQLSDFAGFRLECVHAGRHDGIVYCQAYTTDKAQTYQLHNGTFSKKGPSDCYFKAIRKFLTAIAALQKSYISSTSNSQDGTARVEIRTNLRNACNSLIGLDHHTVKQTMISIPNLFWWRFKFFRLAGIHYALSALKEAAAEQRMLHQSLLLGAILPWMYNALLSREGDSKVQSLLRDACSQHYCPEIDQEEEDNNAAAALKPIGRSRGLYFLCDLKIGEDCYCIPIRRDNSAHSASRAIQPVLLAAYRVPDMASLLAQIGPKPKSRQQQFVDRRAARIRERLASPQRTVEVQRISEDPPMHEHPLSRTFRPSPNTALPALGGGAESLVLDDSGYQILTRIWRQFPSDIFQVSPKYAGGNYSTLNAMERAGAGLEIFMAYDIPLEACQTRVVGSSFWSETLFRRYFPNKEDAKAAKKLQNFRACTYYTTYISLITHLSGPKVASVRRALQRRFNAILWLPYAGTDRMWATKRMPAAHWMQHPPQFASASPQIAINGAHYLGDLIQIRSRIAQMGAVARDQTPLDD
ncbi:hypothetical protein CERSUDRAFT_100111 [Gelatoporia subvermispora B]|uniref:Uncharacterized protein n=1 Tax=Ceriporiopsis subvermispora (strain B) TaxID=914234 RepID=M2Q4C0_CERS8|nr:hypothetical protein CERSUDRAFT_100111 [Gelatoporia subvermispora B]